MKNNRAELAVNGLPNDLLTIDDIAVSHSRQIRSDVQLPDVIFF